MATVDFIKKKDDYRAETQELLLDQFKSSDNYNKVVNVFSEVMEEYESVIVDAAESVLFGNAIGEQLDEMGRQLGVSRTVDDDDEYRSIIALSTLKKLNTGSRDKVHEMLTLHSANNVEFSLGADGLLSIYLTTTCLTSRYGIQAILDLLPVNTYHRIVSVETPSFGFGVNDEGFGTTTDRTTGGKMSSLLSVSSSNQ